MSWRERLLQREKEREGVSVGTDKQGGLRENALQWERDHCNGGVRRGGALLSYPLMVSRRES